MLERKSRWGWIDLKHFTILMECCYIPTLLLKHVFHLWLYLENGSCLDIKFGCTYLKLGYKFLFISLLYICSTKS